MKASEILERIKKAYHLKTDAEVADFLDMKPSTLSMQKNRESLNLKRVIKRCSDVNKNWLLDGEGPIKKKQTKSATQIPVYSSLSIENKKPDFHRSIRAGSLYADVTQELDNFASSKEVFGYVVPQKPKELTLQKGDIAIVNSDYSLSKDSVCLISDDRKVDFKRFSVREDNDTAVRKPAKAPSHLSEYNIIGELVWVIRRVN